MAAANTFRFDPATVAHNEVEGWKAYYDRAWGRLLRLVLALVSSQFRIPFPLSILAAYYVTRASIAWVPKDHDRAAIERSLRRFYAIARRSSRLHFDVARAAALEFDYWEVHRRLVGKPDKTEFVDVMTRLHAEIFGLTEARARESAQLRVEANNVLDTITGRTSEDPASDWERCEILLHQCYASLQYQIAMRSA